MTKKLFVFSPIKELDLHYYSLLFEHSAIMRPELKNNESWDLFKSVRLERT